MDSQKNHPSRNLELLRYEQIWAMAVGHERKSNSIANTSGYGQIWTIAATHRPDGRHKRRRMHVVSKVEN